MKEEALPEMLKELLLEDDDSSIVEYNNKQQKEHFTTNFDPHPNAIIYHAHAHAHAHNSNPTLPNLSPWILLISQTYPSKNHKNVSSF